MDNTTVAFIIICALIATGVIGVSWGVERRQRRLWEEFATQRGWKYQPSSRSIPRKFPTEEPFGRGSSRVATHILTHGEGLSFEYSYKVTTGAGKTSQTRTYRYHVVTLNLPRSFPRLVVRPERFEHKVSKLFGTQDVQFEWEEFNREWLVQADNLRFASDVIDPRMMAWLMDHTGASFIIYGPMVYTFIEDKQRPENIDRLLADLKGFIDRVPHFVWGN